MSLLQQHRKKVLSMQKAQAEDTGHVVASMPRPKSGLVGAQQQLAVLAKALELDLAELKNMPSRERKIEYKRTTLVPRYRNQIKRLMADGKNHKVIYYFMVWCFDAGELDDALAAAEYCIKNAVPAPENFKSSAAYFMAAQIIDWANAQFTAGHDFEPYLGKALAIINDTGAEIDDITKSGFYRLYGLYAVKSEDWAAAVEQLEKAQNLGAKVKTALQEAKKKLEKLTDPAAPGAE